MGCSTCKSKRPLFDPKIERFGESRKATLYLRTAYTNDEITSLTQLTYPLDVQVLIDQKFVIASDNPHQMNGVIDSDTVTHIFHLFKSVDLSMIDYSVPAQPIPTGQKRNIIAFTDYTSVFYPEGVHYLYKILNPDVIEDPAEPYYKKLYCKLQGRITSEGASRF